MHSAVNIQFKQASETVVRIETEILFAFQIRLQTFLSEKLIVIYIYITMLNHYNNDIMPGMNVNNKN